MKNKLKSLILSTIFGLTTIHSNAAEVGVFYYPGWSKPGGDPWGKIKPYPDREPLLGWYNERSDSYTKKYLNWMGKYGISYVIYDWYWENNGGVRDTTYAIDSFIQNAKTSPVDFSILWANHSGAPSGYKQFDEMVRYWITHYFSIEHYKKINGKPVVFIFSHDRLVNDASKFGATAAELMQRARSIAIQNGYKGIYFVGAASADKKKLDFSDLDNTYDALSAYNYHLGYAKNNADRQLSINYPDLARGYEESWRFVLKGTKLDYILPLTSGWDRTPWGGSTNPAHDNSKSTPGMFYDHLKSAQETLKANPRNTVNSVVICCWNEYGEGSYIEPTKKYGFQYLEGIKKYLAQ